MNPGTAQAIRLAIMGVQALVKLGISAQRVQAIADEVEKNGELSEQTISRIESDAEAVGKAWDNS